MEGTACRVICRFRPKSAREEGKRCVTYASDSEVVYNAPEGVSNAFTFSRVFGETVGQAEVYERVGRDVVAATLAGYNGTILTYGQTGSGKTHTLIGSLADPDQHGVVPRAIQQLSEGIAAEQSKGDGAGVQFRLRLSVVEIYKEAIRDLLDPQQRGDNLAVKQDPSGGVYIEGATELPVAVQGQEEMVALMQAGLAQRAVGATGMNEASSRSHCIVTVAVEREARDGGLQCGKLCMVDLAGSERQDKTGAAGSTLQEGAHINRSLSALANVIYALTAEDKAGRHVPYRDSKLTRVLQDSLGGTSRTVLIICCSPAADNGPETLSTLRFGARAAGVKNKVRANQKMSVGRLQQQLEASEAMCEALRQELQALRQQAPAAGGATGLSSSSSSRQGGPALAPILEEPDDLLPQKVPDAADYPENAAAAVAPDEAHAVKPACGLQASVALAPASMHLGPTSGSYVRRTAAVALLAASFLLYTALEDWALGSGGALSVGVLCSV